jgi:hypothetical protein
MVEQEAAKAMDDVFTQVGIGGVFALLMVREILNFLKAWENRKVRKNGGSNGAAGGQSVDFWRTAQYEAARRAMNDVIPLLSGELRELRMDTAKIRESQHRIVEALQTAVGKLDLLVRLIEQRSH